MDAIARHLLEFGSGLLLTVELTLLSLVGSTAQGHAVAVKVIDGSPRATTAIALRALDALGADVAPAAQLGVVPILGGGDQVGEIRTTVSKGTQ